MTYLKLLHHGFHFHRSAFNRFFTLFPFRPVTLLARHRSPAKHITYWHRPHTSLTDSPVVFIHGIGIGLYPYTNFLDEINSGTGSLESTDPNGQIGILALEIMPVSFRITHSAVAREEMCEEISQILNEHFGKDQKVVLVSHSYGTVISTHLLKTPSIAARIGPVVLIDPVSILLHLPDVAYNFTRRKPKEANEHQLYYFASMDMGVSHTLSRHFFWNENVLWKKDLAGRKVMVSLGGRDLIVNTRAVGRYLMDVRPPALYSAESTEEHDALYKQEEDEEWKYRPWKEGEIDLLWWEHLDHAQVFDKSKSRQRLIAGIRSYCTNGNSS